MDPVAALGVGSARKVPECSSLRLLLADVGLQAPFLLLHTHGATEHVAHLGSGRFLVDAVDSVRHAEVRQKIPPRTIASHGRRGLGADCRNVERSGSSSGSASTNFASASSAM
jgi:hypothetical protein